MKKAKRAVSMFLAAFMIISAPLYSYQEAQAAEAGTWALMQVLQSLLISSGLSSCGYIGQNVSISKEQEQEIYNKMVNSVTGGFMGTILDDASSRFQNAYADYLEGQVIHASVDGVTISGSKSEGLKVKLSSDVVKTCANGVKAFLESDENKVDVVYDSDSLGADMNYDDIDVTVKTVISKLSNYESISDAAVYFANPVIDDMFDEYGVSDKTHIVFAYSNGRYIFFSCFPLDRCALFMGYSQPLFLSSDTMSRVMRSVAVDGVSNTYNAYKQYSSGEGFCIQFDKENDSWIKGTVRDYYSYHSYYSSLVFNFQNYMALGNTVQSYKSNSSRTVFSYRTKGNAISYDTSRAISYSDGVSFSLSDDDVMEGFDSYDLDTLLDYVSSLSEEMAEWRAEQTANQETIIEQNTEIIQQNKSLLTAVGGINSTVAKISTNVGKTVSLLASLEGYFASLPMDIADALAEVFPAIEIDYDTLAGAVSGALADTYTTALPGVLTDALADVFPNVSDAIEVLIDLPAYLLTAISGITVKVPEITIPDIVIPEIAVPDVFVEAPAITLNPSYDITVANDYAGLEGVISGAVEGVLTDVFVPDEAAITAKLDDMGEYFKFTDDVKDIISEFEKSVFGIVPSPILKIPIGKPKSKKYNYGTGSYFIIDVSWYAEYKDFGDKLVLAFAWAVFIWRIFVLLPGIISGAVGSFFEVGDIYADASIDRAYRKYQKYERKYTDKGDLGL